MIRIQHDLHFYSGYKNGIAFLEHPGPLGDNPDLVERINRKIADTKSLRCLGIKFLPEITSKFILGINQGCCQLLENIVLGQKIAPHFGTNQLIRDNSFGLNRRKVDP